MPVGRIATPSELQKLKGRSHHKKKETQELPMDTVGAKEDFTPVDPNEIWQQLVRKGIAKQSDSVAFSKYYDFYNVYNMAKNKLSETGLTIVSNKGKITINPLWSVILEAQQAMLKIEREFGLTPASKRKVLAGVMPVIDTTMSQEEKEYADFRKKG